jgi:glycosyltransferase involved in cell wall biosynthesis
MLPRAIHSVLNQTDGDWKLVIADDGSTDNTQEVVERFKDDRIVYYKRVENQGLVYTFNEMLDRVIKMPEMQYWSWLASDDELMPHFVETHVQGLQTSQKEVTWSDFTSNTNGRLQRVNMRIDPSKIQEASKRRMCISLASVCILGATLRKIKERYGVFCSPDFKHMNDWDFLVKLASVTSSFHYIAESLATYYIHKDMGSAGVYFGNAESAAAKQFLKERARVR